MNYVNYHSHSMYSNIATPDSTITNRDRALRVQQLGQTVLGGIEHSWCGRFIEIIELSKEMGVKPLLGTEAYFVKDRFEKDNTNAHLILLAKNENGRKAINRILSEANETGFYYKPRIDISLLLSLPKSDVWVTTACIGGVWKYEDHDDLIIQMFEYFGKNNFFLEVQAHNVEKQIIINKHILNLSNKYGIKIIAGMDSHMISQYQAQNRDDYLLSRGISYPDEDHWDLDFPSYDDAYDRFVEQDVLNKNQIKEALENTLIFEGVEIYNSPIFNKDVIKLPTLYPDKTQEERNKILEDIICASWDQEKVNVPTKLHEHYQEEIDKELDTVFATNTTDYFLLDYEIVKRGKELGGSITLTGRGSAVSFYISKLLGLTTIDRIAASVKLFPERFISKERLLEAKSLPDVDLNLGTPEIFGQAQKEVMGFNHSYPMIAFGTLKALGAWKLYSRVAQVPFDEANIVSEQLQQYELDIKHADEEDREDINVLDYIDPAYHRSYEESKKYLGLVNSLTPHPCGWLLFNSGDIREEFGLVKIKTGNVEHICVACDGLFAEKYKLLKNDLLKVSVVDLIYRVYKRIGIQPHSLPELIKICDGDQAVWDIYKNACTIGINQFEQIGTSGRGAKYAPKNISEISAFVAAIRPGFKSNYKQFEAREHFEYGIPSLDKLIQTEEFPESYMLYQENAMQVLAYSGIPISETYEIVKNIAKKRAEKVYKYKEQFISGMRNKLHNFEHQSLEDANRIAEMTWKVIEDSAFYSFNASHSYSYAGDSLYGAYLKAHYPVQFYEVFLQMMEEDGDKDRLAYAKAEAEKHFHIKFPPYRFGQDNRGIVGNVEEKQITQSLKSIKGFGQEIGDDLYSVGQDQYDNWLDFLIKIEEKGILSKRFESLIKINYFEQFGNNKKLYDFFIEFTKGKNRYSHKLTEKTRAKRLPELQALWNNMLDERFGIHQQITYEKEILGTIQMTYPVDKRYIYVEDLNDKFAPRILAYCLATGKVQSLKIQRKIFEYHAFMVGDIIFCENFEKKPTVQFKNGKYIEVEGEYTWWISSYHVVNDYTKIIGTGQ